MLDFSTKVVAFSHYVGEFKRNEKNRFAFIGNNTSVLTQTSM